ncbi:MAG: penicillin-binding protein 2, partial [Rhodobacteraceae bacterium]|nr:penicillin-binding protein 2 [Paracoccaceae bacterium]
ENRINIRLLPPARGNILDRDGRLLAGNRQNYRIVMVREQAGDPAAVLARLATIIDLPQEARDRVLREMMARSAFVPVVVAEHLSWDDVVRVAANSPVLPGVEPEVGLSRFYPDGPSTAHVVGYVGPVSERDLEKLEDPDPVLQIPRFQIGKTGVEERLEPLLRGHAGNQRIEVSAAGRVMRELGRTEGQSGRDVNLTIDAELQIYAMQRMEGQSAAAVVIDVQNGDIVALASAPGFDPSSFVFGIRSGEWNALLNDEYRPLSNKTVAGTYPPGSTFKMCVALAALETGAARPGDTVFCGGSTSLGKRRFHCWKHGGHGTVDMRRSLSQSCDVFYYEMARRVGPDAISAMAHKLGLGIAHDLPMPAVAAGNMPDAEWKKIHRSEKWTTGDSFNYGIGQGFTLASPLQLAVYAARIAGGRSIAPRLVRAVGGEPVEIPAAEPLAIAPKHLEVVRGGMFAVSNEGTAYRSRFVDPANLMAGKTGTSQVR